MKILVTHLTRMSGRHICAAGFETAANQEATQNHIRPVDGQLDKELLRIFQLGAVVDLGVTKPVGQSPETEDHSFDPTSASIISKIPQEKFWSSLEHSSKESLHAAFGSDLMEHDHGAVVNPGTGQGSLGELQVSKKPNLYVNDFGQLRIQVEDPDFVSLDLSVTDVRFYEHNGIAWSLSMDLVQTAIKKVNVSIPRNIILAVGLTRAFRGFHWLQANNIYFRESPLWTEPSAMTTEQEFETSQKLNRRN
jgi:hypothetical protein